MIPSTALLALALAITARAGSLANGLPDHDPASNGDSKCQDPGVATCFQNSTTLVTVVGSSLTPDVANALAPSVAPGIMADPSHRCKYPENRMCSPDGSFIWICSRDKQWIPLKQCGGSGHTGIPKCCKATKTRPPCCACLDRLVTVTETVIGDPVSSPVTSPEESVIWSPTISVNPEPESTLESTLTVTVTIPKSAAHPSSPVSNAMRHNALNTTVPDAGDCPHCFPSCNRRGDKKCSPNGSWIWICTGEMYWSPLKKCGDGCCRAAKKKSPWCACLQGAFTVTETVTGVPSLAPETPPEDTEIWSPTDTDEVEEPEPTPEPTITVTLTIPAVGSAVSSPPPDVHITGVI